MEIDGMQTLFVFQWSVKTSQNSLLYLHVRQWRKNSGKGKACSTQRVWVFCRSSSTLLSTLALQSNNHSFYGSFYFQTQLHLTLFACVWSGLPCLLKGLLSIPPEPFTLLFTHILPMTVKMLSQHLTPGPNSIGPPVFLHYKSSFIDLSKMPSSTVQYFSKVIYDF